MHNSLFMSQPSIRNNICNKQRAIAHHFHVLLTLLAFFILSSTKAVEGGQATLHIGCTSNWSPLKNWQHIFQQDSYSICSIRGYGQSRPRWNPNASNSFNSILYLIRANNPLERIANHASRVY